MSNYFTKAQEQLDVVSYPYEVHDDVFSRMMGYIGFIRMNLLEDSDGTIKYLDDLVLKILAVMQLNTLSVTQKIDMYHQMAHELADQHIKLSSGEMSTDNLWYPGCAALL